MRRMRQMFLLVCALGLGQLASAQKAASQPAKPKEPTTLTELKAEIDGEMKIMCDLALINAAEKPDAKFSEIPVECWREGLKPEERVPLFNDPAKLRELAGEVETRMNGHMEKYNKLLVAKWAKDGVLADKLEQVTNKLEADNKKVAQIKEKSINKEMKIGERLILAKDLAVLKSSIDPNEKLKAAVQAALKEKEGPKKPGEQNKGNGRDKKKP